MGELPNEVRLRGYSKKEACTLRCRPLDVQERTVREGVKLLNLNLSASLFQLLLDVVSLSLGDLLLDSLGSAINDSLSLLQAPSLTVLS